MADLNSVQSINQEVFGSQNDVGSKGAYEIVAMSAATAVQNKLTMYNNFEAVSQSVLAVAAKKYAEAAAEKDVDGMKNWQTVMETMTANVATEAKNLEAFNTMAEDLANNFPKGGS